MAADAVEPQRQVVRLSVDYYLTLQGLLMSVAGGDLLSSTLFLAISRANIRNLAARGEQFATLGDIPPDELREPVSVYAIARELGLPYETVRRHVNKLVEAGLCERNADGRLVVPASVYARPAFQQVTRRNWAVTRDYLGALLEAGMTPATKAD